MLLPCEQAHLLCPDCCEVGGDFCDLCGKHFDWHDFQLLQPGFECSDFIIEKPRDGTAAAPGGAGAGADVTATAPATTTATGGSGSIHSVHRPLPRPVLANSAGLTRSSKIDHVLARIEQLEGAYQQLTRRMFAVASSTAAAAAAAHCDASDGAGGGGVHFALPDSHQARTPVLLSTTATAGVSAGTGVGVCTSSATSPLPLTPKVVVFSQFVPFLDRLLLELRTKGILFADAYHPNPEAKAISLRRFQHSNSCRVLLLHHEGSHGLDLRWNTTTSHSQHHNQCNNQHRNHHCNTSTSTL